jgi:hypothetical protein
MPLLSIQNPSPPSNEIHMAMPIYSTVVHKAMQPIELPNSLMLNRCLPFDIYRFYWFPLRRQISGCGVAM